MKKMLSILLAVMMLFAIAVAAAEEIPQPEGGKKFESDWAFNTGMIQIYYEEEGYRVSVNIENPEEPVGCVWEYSCIYKEETDSLISISSSKTEYTFNQSTGDREFKEDAYSGLDEENNTSEFTLDENGYMHWKDGHENAGADLQFSNIGRFEGMWKNEAEETKVDFMWEGMDPDRFDYTVYITRGSEKADTFAQYLMTGEYDPATGKLTANGTCTVFTKNAEGEYDPSDDGEEFEAVFSKTEDGKLVYETENGIELEYDLLGGVG